MTTLELFKKHRKGEVSRDKFLYEVRRDSNLPWVTNTTSYDDAVKILKNKGIIRESAVVPEDTLTSPAADRVNPYFLKKGVEKELENRKDLNNNSYEEALNKAANKLAKDPHAFDDLLIHNASDIHKKDEKLATKEVKKNNFVDKDNGMKKIKGQQAPKATSAPTKENKKTKKPKGVEVMKDKGVEGKEKVIKEMAEYLKKKLALAENTYHDFHEGQVIPMEEGEGKIKEINGGTLTLEMPDGSLKDVQMNHAKRMIDKSKEPVEEDQLQEVSIPENIKKFAKRKGVTNLVNQAARWAEKSGKRIVGGTAIGKNYDTLILDLTHQGGEIRINCVDETMTVNDEEVRDYESFVSALQDDSVKAPETASDTSKEIEESKKSGFDILSLNVWIDKIKSYIATSSVFDVGFKEYVLKEIEYLKNDMGEGDWHEALLSLEDIDDAIQQVNPKEYQQAYARLFNTAIAKLEVLDEKNEDWEEEELDEFTTAKTTDSAHNADVLKRINTKVQNPVAKKDLTTSFNAGNTIDL